VPEDMLALFTTVKWLFITTSLVDVGVLIVTTGKWNWACPPTCKSYTATERICWLHVMKMLPTLRAL